MQTLITSLLPLFSLIGCGFVLRRRGFPNEGFWPGAERLNYFLFFPALLFKSLATAPLDNPALPHMAMSVGLVLGMGWVMLLMIRRLRVWKANRFGVFTQGALRFNTYIGLATIGSLFGPRGLALVSLLVALTVPVVNILSVYALTSEKGTRPGAVALTIIKNPLILACVAGVVVNVLGIQHPTAISDLLGMLAATSLPLGLLCVGAALQPEELKGETAALVTSSASRLLLVPGTAFLIGWLLNLPPMEHLILAVFFGLPCAPTAYVLTRQLGGDAHLMAGVITLQTLLSAVTLPLLLRLVG